MSKKYTSEEYIPVEVWGKDHWSTLAYIDALMVDHKGKFEMKGDARMRSNRRHFRLMPTPNGVTMSPEHGSRLLDGSIVAGHDDWCCVQDFANAGLLNRTPEQLEPGVVFKLSTKGNELVERLRVHKKNGGTFSNFKV